MATAFIKQSQKTTDNSSYNRRLRAFKIFPQKYFLVKRKLPKEK